MPNKLYSSLDALDRRFRKVERTLSFKAQSADEWKQWRRKLRRRLWELIGLDTMQMVPARPRLTETIDCGDHIRQRVEIHTDVDVVMPMYVLIPKSGSGPFPVMLCPHGHCAGGKIAVAGVADDPAVADAIKLFNYDYGVQLVREGFICFCPDSRGFGERREEKDRDNLFDSSCRYLQHMGLPLGQTVGGMWTWDLMRLLDYVGARTDCRRGPIGCAGLSGGGYQTLFLAALDDRISCAVDSGYFYGSRESLIQLYDNCDCNYTPHLWQTVDMGDIGALIAPRPFLVETGTEDPLNGASGVKNVRSQMRVTRRAYRLLGAVDRLAHDVFEGGHRWNGVKAIPWLKKWL